MTSQTAATERATPQALEALYNRITGDEDARVCKDIPESACHDQPRNFFAYLGANLLGKVADEIASAKLVIPWLFGALGVPAVFTGLLVPIREGRGARAPACGGCGGAWPAHPQGGMAARRRAFGSQSVRHGRRGLVTERDRGGPGPSLAPWSSSAWRVACARYRRRMCSARRSPRAGAGH
jgi:hypothetical protein